MILNVFLDGMLCIRKELRHEIYSDTDSNDIPFDE